MTTITITLPWPARELSPNFHGGWRAKWQAQQAANHDGQIAALKSWEGKERPDFGDGPISIKAKFYPPDQRRRDHDNAFASMKHYYDGIARALGVDDNRFRPTYEWGVVSPLVRGGGVIIEIG